MMLEVSYAIRPGGTMPNEMMMPAADTLTTPLTRHQAEDAIEVLLAYLDALDGDADLEDDSEDFCAGGEDLGTTGTAGWASDHMPGEPEDAEEGGDLEPDGTDLPASPYAGALNQDPTDDLRHKHLLTPRRMAYLGC